jgi:hypothetical protein
LHDQSLGLGACEGQQTVEWGREIVDSEPDGAGLRDRYAQPR